MNNKKFIEDCESKLRKKFKAVDEIAYFNQVKVIEAFREYRVALRHFNATKRIRRGRRGSRYAGESDRANIRSAGQHSKSANRIRNACYHVSIIRSVAPGRHRVISNGRAVRYAARRYI